jgi:BMFP domain-containing protein YqiC
MNALTKNEFVEATAAVVGHIQREFDNKLAALEAKIKALEAQLAKLEKP